MGIAEKLRGVNGGFGKIAAGEVEFRCLKLDDPALQRPAK
jgi:hypothetical protein